MRALLIGHDADVAHWVALNIPHMLPRIPYFERGLAFGPCRAIGVLDATGQIIAGVVYHNHDPFVGAMEISCAAITAKWGNRETFRSLLRFPFAQAQCQRVTAVTPRRAPPGATSPRKFLEGLGFVREGSIRRGFGDQNAIVYGLLREEWEQGRFCRPRREGLTGGEEIGSRGAPGARSARGVASPV